MISLKLQINPTLELSHSKSFAKPPEIHLNQINLNVFFFNLTLTLSNNSPSSTPAMLAAPSLAIFVRYSPCLSPSVVELRWNPYPVESLFNSQKRGRGSFFSSTKIGVFVDIKQ